VGRTVVTAAGLVLATAAWSAPAAAALYLTFTTTQAASGTLVVAQTGGTGALANLPASAALDVFLAPAEEAETIMSVDDSRLVRIGRLRVDEQGNGHLRFVVPELPPGDYTTLTHCAPCARFSAGRQLVSTGPFDGAFVVLDEADGDGFPPDLRVLGVGGALLVSGAAGLWMIRRR
jgi:hypothetical protein